MFSLFSEPFLLAVAVTALCFFLALFSLFRPFSFRFSFARFTPPFNHCASSDSEDSVPYLNGSVNGSVADMMEISPSHAPVVLADRRSGSSMMEELVPEITTHALSYLDYPSLCRLSMTNSLMRKAANDDNAWKALYHKVNSLLFMLSFCPFQYIGLEDNR